MRHHQHIMRKQNKFATHVNDFCISAEKMGNPFTEDSSSLLTLHTRDVVDELIPTVRNIEETGTHQFHKFIDERLSTRQVSLFDPIRKNKLLSFTCPPLRTVSRLKKEIELLKRNCSLFSQLYVSSQVRGGDLQNFFAHENQPYPPSLSQYGVLRSGTKSTLTSSMEKLANCQDGRPDVDVILLDGAVIVRMLKPVHGSTFSSYFSDILMKYIEKQLQGAQRLDLVFDVYHPNSLKHIARDRRGKGVVRRRMEHNAKIPNN